MAATLGTAWIQIKPSMKGMTGDLKKDLGGVESAADGMVGKLSIGFGNLGSVITGAFAVSKVFDFFSAAANKLKDFTADTVMKVGQYEQVADGVKKIFNEMDNSVIFSDAKQAYKNLNISAGTYLETITQVGANFAATMGDKTGYETAKRGLQAIADFSSGTGRSIDELIDKYTMISRNASVYQSIADQFSGILPQTRNDFLEQAQALGLLSTEYTNLSQVATSEYQNAVTAMIEYGVANLGLLGNTAKESDNTIMGSINSLKSAWENLLVDLGVEGANLEEDIEILADRFEKAWEQVVPVVERILEKLFPILAEVAQKIWDKIEAWLNDPENQRKLQEWSENLMSGISKAAEIVGDVAARSLARGLFWGLKDFVKNAWVPLGRQIDNIVTGLNSLFGWNIPTITNLFDGLWAEFDRQVWQYADGGIVRGVGTSTSDSNLIRASDGEFVIRAAAAREIGYGNLAAMNETGRVSGGNTFIVNGYNKDPEELWRVFSRKMALAERGVLA